MKINPPSKIIKQGIELYDLAQGKLLPSFIYLILGKPGSGKSHLLASLINDSRYFGNRFDYVFFIGTTKYQGIEQDQQNSKATFSLDWIFDIIKTINKNYDKSQKVNILFVCDDVISQIFQARSQQRFKALMCNRRHLIPGTISFLITAQKYMLLPPMLRTVLDGLWIFKLPAIDQQTLVKQISTNIPKNSFRNILNNLQPHQYVYLNMRTSKLYNDELISY